MSEQFKAGSVVQLNSGGPLMTVRACRGDGEVDCFWFVGGSLSNEVFDPGMIGEVSPVAAAMSRQARTAGEG